MKRSILLDLDGTIVDSLPGIQASVIAALRELGHEPDPAFSIQQYVGPPLEDVLRILLEPHGDNRIGEAAVAYRRHYGASGLFGCVQYSGIADALDEMKRSGFELYVATSKRETFATRILDHLNLAVHFNAIHGSIPDGSLDHKLELLAHIAAAYGLSPAHTFMVGDRRHDVAGARAVGMRAIGVLWGYGSREELETAGADQLAEAPGDLTPMLLSMSA